LFKSKTTTTSGNRSVKGKLVNVNSSVNFTQIVKKANEYA